MGAFASALETINKCLSEAICSLARGRLDGESRTSGLILAGNDILQTCKYYPEVRYNIIIVLKLCFKLKMCSQGVCLFSFLSQSSGRRASDGTRNDTKRAGGNTIDPQVG